MEQLPKIVRERLAASAKPGVHPDPDLLTAFVENALLDRERSAVLDHLVECAECRELVALTAPQMELQHMVAAAAAPAPVPLRSSRLRAPALRWAAVAASVIVVGAAVLVYRQTREKRAANLASVRQDALKAAPFETFAKLEPAEKATAPQTPPAQKPAAADRREKGRGGEDKMTIPSPPAESDARRTSQAPERRDRTASSSMGGAEASRADRPFAGKPSAGSETQSAATRIAGNRGGIGSAQPSTPPANALKVAPSKKEESIASRIVEKTLAPVAPASPSAANEVAAVQLPAPSTTETVAIAAPGAKPDSDSRAKAKTLARERDAGAFAGIAQYGKEQNLDQMSKAANVRTPRWVLSKDGTMLLRSNDEGKTWQMVFVANRVVLLSVDAFGAEIWAGGGGGALYHSVDEGEHWTQVKPVTEGKALRDDITQIRFTDPQHGQLSTLHHQVWTTADGGRTWQMP